MLKREKSVGFSSDDSDMSSDTDNPFNTLAPKTKTDVANNHETLSQTNVNTRASIPTTPVDGNDQAPTSPPDSLVPN
jgi:hypothetical protein